MDALQKIRWHLGYHRGPWLSLLAVIATATAVIGLGIWHQDATAAKKATIRHWPVATATILESRIIMSDASTETSHDVRITVSGQLRYPHPDRGEITLPFFLDSGGTHPRDWQGTFKPGAQVSIHYNPERPADLSFIEFTGAP